MHFLGIDWVGLNADNRRKLLLSLAFVAVVLVVSRLLRWLIGVVLNSTEHATVQSKFWMRQAISLLATILLPLGLLSIWFSDPTRLATALGLVSAGLAFALQQPVTALASYFVILRGGTFTVGDRISMGGVRGDVIRLGFIQTTIMEMGQPPAVEDADPAMWVKSRQFTGRIVTVSNAKIFAEPVFNYTRDFPYIWEEMAIPITYTADRVAAERIILAAAGAHAIPPDSIAAEAKRDLQDRFGVTPVDFTPHVYYRITDNWLELTVRFAVHLRGIRNVKDAMARDILTEFDKLGIGIASSTYDIVGLPPVELRGPR
ncbi:mechanosensitive ion channel family protein [Sphingomonas bacterium]|uniref:mechanosensitive ion channel family protein n=1 Tax=Sphingomonas bacterium TaxID=1895847 RepID=UPI001576E67C|nr:mechanosensitive ion channel domain-containing protein [Sphingomonas bacterium]